MKTRSADVPISPAPGCPACRAVLDGWTSVHHEDEPQAGDFTICAYCLEGLTFTADMRLRRLTPAERAEFMAMPDTQSALAALRAAPFRRRALDG